MSLMEKYSDDEVIKVLKAYLIDAWSHRRIQSEILGIPAPARGGGFEAMKILHRFNIKGDKKGILIDRNIEEEIKTATGAYLEALELVRDSIK